jgi:hypothetical protein
VRSGFNFLSLIATNKVMNMPSAMSADQLGIVLVNILKSGTPEAGIHNARAMLAAASAFMRDTCGHQQARDVLKSIIVGIDNIDLLVNCEPSSQGAN